MKKPSKWRIIYTGDYTAIGYEKRLAAGKQGAPKSHFGTLGRHWLNYLWFSAESGKSYAKGYDSGYEAGQRVRTNVYHQQTTEHLMDLESLRRIYGNLQQGENSLRENIRLLNLALEKYRRQVQAARAAGFLRDYTDKLQENLRRLEARKEEMCQQLTLMIAALGQAREYINILIASNQ